MRISTGGIPLLLIVFATNLSACLADLASPGEAISPIPAEGFSVPLSIIIHHTETKKTLGWEKVRYKARGWCPQPLAGIIFGMSKTRSGSPPEACYATQRILHSAVETHNMDHPEQPIRNLTPKVIEGLVKMDYLKCPIQLPSPECQFYSFGDLESSGRVSCIFHGSSASPYKYADIGFALPGCPIIHDHTPPFTKWWNRNFEVISSVFGLFYLTSPFLLVIPIFIIWKTLGAPKRRKSPDGGPPA